LVNIIFTPYHFDFKTCFIIPQSRNSIKAKKYTSKKNTQPQPARRHAEGWGEKDKKSFLKNSQAISTH
jgi:hypothetical protein